MGMASGRRSAAASAPFGHAATGANPTDRGKQGTKRSLLTDGAGIPLALVVDGANRHDVKLLSATLDGLVISRASANRRAATAPLFGCSLRLHSSLQRAGRTPLSAPRPQSRGRATSKRDRSWLSSSSLGSGTQPFLDQSLTSSARAVGKEGGKLSGFPSSGLCSTHLCQVSGFRISF